MISTDPLFIVQTAQELLDLAVHKMQQKEETSPGLCRAGGIDWQRKYEAERDLRIDKENRIRELEGEFVNLITFLMSYFLQITFPPQKRNFVR